MEKLPAHVWLDRCIHRITEVEHGISTDEARRLARAMRSFERTAVMPPEAAVDFVASEMAKPQRGRFERRTRARG